MKASRPRTVSTVAEAAAGILTGLLLFGGVASAAEIDTTGPDSTNIISSSNKCDVRVDNDNDVTVVNNNPQTAVPGDADADRNTNVGSVSSGDASNSSEANFEVSITNGGASCNPEDRPSVTPTEVTPGVTTPTRPMGGMGGGAAEVAQVLVPVGGVGAGSGGPAYLGGLLAVTLGTGAYAVARANRSLKNRMY